MFSNLRKTTLTFWVTFNLSSANAFHLGKPKILSSGKGFISGLSGKGLNSEYHGKGVVLVSWPPVGDEVPQGIYLFCLGCDWWNTLINILTQRTNIWYCPRPTMVCLCKYGHQTPLKPLNPRLKMFLNCDLYPWGDIILAETILGTGFTQQFHSNHC